MNTAYKELRAIQKCFLHYLIVEKCSPEEALERANVTSETVNIWMERDKVFSHALRLNQEREPLTLFLDLKQLYEDIPAQSAQNPQEAMRLTCAAYNIETTHKGGPKHPTHNSYRDWLIEYKTLSPTHTQESSEPHPVVLHPARVRQGEGIHLVGSKREELRGVYLATKRANELDSPYQRQAIFLTLFEKLKKDTSCAYYNFDKTSAITSSILGINPKECEGWFRKDGPTHVADLSAILLLLRRPETCGEWRSLSIYQDTLGSPLYLQAAAIIDRMDLSTSVLAAHSDTEGHTPASKSTRGGRAGR